MKRPSQERLTRKRIERLARAWERRDQKVRPPARSNPLCFLRSLLFKSKP